MSAKAVQEIGAILICFFLCGCVTTYTPVSKSLLGGYSDMKIQDDIFSISFRGNAYTSMERAGAFTLLRCAEVTLENGYNYFTILSGGTNAEWSAYTTPVRSYTTGASFGNTYTDQTSYSGGQTFVIRKPKSGCIIQCFREKQENIMVLDAKQVRDNIKAKYKIK